MSIKVAFLLLSAVVAAEGYSFITLGDWGGAALEEPSKPYSKNVQEVSGIALCPPTALRVVLAAMASSAEKNSIKFVVNTGDNFYWCGIQNVTDFQVQKDWIEPFQQSKALQVPW